MAAGSRVRLPCGVEAAVDGQQLAALAVALERAVGELRHGHVEHHGPGGARHGDDQRIVADGALGAAPGRQVGHGVGPADADEAGLGGLPAVGAAAHPVVGVAQRDAADAVLAAERDGAVHRGQRVEIAGAALAVPALQRAKGSEAPGLRVRLRRCRCGWWRRSAESG